MDGERVRHDLALVVVAAQDPKKPVAGRLVAFEEGRWRLSLPAAGERVEVRGDRWEGGREAARLLLGPAGGG